ncbi:c5bd3642-af16-4947-bec4-7866ddec707b [Thermothielavioides terrestris]|uniref:C5bd3642-af16-4947-bec4-7866ddec707b n=1 Tax=Thermothielavioides terrestris TaxID=2587410 RepID=A0A446B7G9_9PEZI|nr:c5bd3642-af16-4947-bec4-7866ddec707b [Thermothielavioides terrestris]
MFGGEYTTTPLQEITTSRLRYNFNVSFEANFSSTWTLCTGSQGDVATHPIPAMTQGALFSMATAACRENANTNVRFNEVYLMFRVEVDEVAARNGTTRASDFAHVYEGILANSEIRSSRVRVDTVDAIKNLKYERKF